MLNVLAFMCGMFAFFGLVYFLTWLDTRKSDQQHRRHLETLRKTLNRDPS